MNQTILFVDDDPKAIQGLRRSLHDQAGEWDLYFANSGQAALSILENYPMDILVAKLRLAGMDGVELLHTVMDRFPSVVRIGLSGGGEASMALRAAPYAHQILAKSNDATLIRQTIQRLSNLRALLHNPKLIRTLTGTRKLPSLPSHYLRLTKEIQSPDVSPKVIGDIISQDVSMTAKVLQLVNSAFFSLPTKIVNPQRAVTLLGINTLKALILYNQVFTQYAPSRDVPGVSLEYLWRHSLMVGSLAREIMQRENRDPHLLDEVHMAGILHDIGKIIELNITGFYRQFELAVKLNKQTAISAEYEILGVTHAELGAYLLSIWGMPTSVVEAVAYHHLPARQPYSDFSALACVHVADWVMNLEAGLDGKSQKQEADLQFLKANHLLNKKDTWSNLAKMVQRSYQSPAAMEQANSSRR